MLSDRLELGGVNREHLLQSLDLLHEVLWHIGHGAWDAMLALVWKYFKRSIQKHKEIAELGLDDISHGTGT